MQSQPLNLDLTMAETREVFCRNLDLTWIHCTLIFGLIWAVDGGRMLHHAQVFLASMFARTTWKIIVDVLHCDFSANARVHYNGQLVECRHQFVAEGSLSGHVGPWRGSEILVKNAQFIVSWTDSSFPWNNSSFLRNDSSKKAKKFLNDNLSACF